MGYSSLLYKFLLQWILLPFAFWLAVYGLLSDVRRFVYRHFLLMITSILSALCMRCHRSSFVICFDQNTNRTKRKTYQSLRLKNGCKFLMTLYLDVRLMILRLDVLLAIYWYVGPSPPFSITILVSGQFHLEIKYE